MFTIAEFPNRKNKHPNRSIPDTKNGKRKNRREKIRSIPEKEKNVFLLIAHGHKASQTATLWPHIFILLQLFSSQFGPFPWLFGRRSVYDLSDCQSPQEWGENVLVESPHATAAEKKEYFSRPPSQGAVAFPSRIFHTKHTQKRQKSLAPIVGHRHTRPLLPIDASPAKTCLWAGGRAEHESRASSSTYTKRLRNLLIPMIKSRPSSFHSPPPPSHSSVRCSL